MVLCKTIFHLKKSLRPKHLRVITISQFHDPSISPCCQFLMETVRTGKKQIIKLPLTVNESAADAEDHKIIRAKEVKTVAMRHLKLGGALKKEYATVYDQCSQEMRDKLESTDDWDKTQKEQLLEVEELIRKIERICVGFDDHKQEVFNLMQAVKTLYLYTQGEKESVEK